MTGAFALSTFTFNEKILAIFATAFGMWAMWLVVTMPWSGVRLFFALATLLPGLALLLIQVKPIAVRLQGQSWGDSPATVRVRQVIHFFLGWSCAMVGVAICVGTATNPIHSLIYFAVALIHMGKTLRLNHYDR